MFVCSYISRTRDFARVGYLTRRKSKYAQNTNIVTVKNCIHISVPIHKYSNRFFYTHWTEKRSFRPNNCHPEVLAVDDYFDWMYPSFLYANVTT